MARDPLEELEAYNKDFNRRMANRKVTNLITCNCCRGDKGYSYECEWHICYRCKGTGYIEQ